LGLCFWCSGVGLVALAAVAGLNGVELGEGFFEVVSADLVVVDVDRRARRLVEEPSLFVVVRPEPTVRCRLG
jgi:hypothetical protein